MSSNAALPQSSVSSSESSRVTAEVRRWDRVGGWLSALCALHCLVTPFVTLSLPFWVYTIHYSPIHLAIALFVIPIGAYSFWQGYKRHGKSAVMIFGILGLALVMVSLIVPSSREQLRWNDIMTLVGSFSLITAHGINRWQFRRA